MTLREFLGREGKEYKATCTWRSSDGSVHKAVVLRRGPSPQMVRASIIGAMLLTDQHPLTIELTEE